MDRFEWERLIRELDLPASVKCTAYAIATYVNAKDGTRGHPGRGKLSRATGLNRATVTATLAALEAGGLVVRESRGGGGRGSSGLSAVYRLATPEDAATPAETGRAVRQVFEAWVARKRSRAAPSNKRHRLRSATSDDSHRLRNARSQVAQRASQVAQRAPITPISPLPTSSLNSGPVINGSVEGSQGALGQDQVFSGDGERPRPASPGRDAPPPEDPKAAGDLAYKIIRNLPREAAAKVHATVAAMLRDRIEAKRIETALPAWHESGKPPGALPEFVEPPAEAETAP
jgi:DNA-binding transcriptional ArsR family regulator